MFNAKGGRDLVRMHKCHAVPGQFDTSAGVAVALQGKMLATDCTIPCRTKGEIVQRKGSHLKMVRCKITAEEGVEAICEGRLELSHCRGAHTTVCEWRPLCE